MSQLQNLRIELVTEESEIPELCHLAELTMSSDSFYEFSKLYAPKSFSDEIKERLETAFRDPTGHIFKAVATVLDGSGQETKKIVGMAQWDVGYINLPKVDPFAITPDSVTSTGIEKAGVATLLSGPSVALNPYSELGRKLGNSHVSAIRGKKQVYLRRMVVHPDYQRRGVGRRLLQWGIDIADRDKIVGWLFARPAGLRLYEQGGWKVVESSDFEVPGLEASPIFCMLRLPRQRRGGEI